LAGFDQCPRCFTSYYIKGDIIINLDVLKLIFHRHNDLFKEYRSNNPKWEVVLDIDALGTLEGESWVFKGDDVYEPDDGSPPRRMMISLSRGGADATVRREFDLKSLNFISPENGISYQYVYISCVKIYF
jgi:prolyl oligopeptidase PreP (S9A serine peptidase family)